MADEGVDIFEGLSDAEMFDGFGEGTPGGEQTEPEDEDVIEEEPEKEEQADQPADEPEEEPEESKEEPVEEAKTEDQLFSLKHLGETKDYSKEETITLAQKGLDYDRIRTERDALKAEKASLQEHEDFLKELAALANTSIEQLMVDTKAKLVQADEKKKGNNITLEQAKYRVETEAKIKKAEAPKASKRDESFQRFTEQYPGVDEIPKEVWAEFGDGSKVDLSVAYTRYLNNEALKKSQEELAKVQERLKVLEQNEKNKKRSTGSRRSNGAPTVDKDLEGWGEY